ncbi:putative hmg box protein [Erysiphe necator]|uniref:Putative hmg box protein n=1 Tax=Uncinula necator TaxID=52586 RepID=A0A0B1P913_UNCNE|nr:putative hmg box protein [Erysiphe necator]
MTLLASSPESTQILEPKELSSSFEDNQCSNLRQSPDSTQERTILSRPKGNKKYNCKGQSKKIKLIDEPLSNFTKDLTPIPDILSYVSRSTEERRKEIKEGKKPEKIKRPMNAFMLYRKAFQNIAKVLFAKNNHQVISQVCGQSWELENAPIKSQFHDWAQIERDNHHKAFPEYKFSPSKPDPSKVSKRRSSTNLILDDSDSETRPWESASLKRAKKYDDDYLRFFSCDQSNSSFRSQESNSSFASNESDVPYLCHGHSFQNLSKHSSLNPIVYHDTSRLIYQETKLGEPITNSVDFKLQSEKYIHQSLHHHHLTARDPDTTYCKIAMLDSSRYCHHNQELQQNDNLIPASHTGVTRMQEQSVNSALSTINPIGNSISYLDYQLHQSMNYEGQENFVKGAYWSLPYNSLAPILDESELNSGGVDRNNIYLFENLGQFDEMADWTMS